MEYANEIIIDLPRDRVLELFDSTENLYKWQDGLQSFEHISGEPGQVGAKSKMLYDMDGRQVEMIETITSRNLPDEFSSTYEAKGVYNAVENLFYEEGPDKTRWVANHEFRFSGVMKIMAVAMRGSFPKQTQKTMEAFKAFAEGYNG